MSDPAVLVERELGTVRASARRYARRRGIDQDEAESDALLALFHAARTWDPARGAFSVHAGVQARRAVIDGYRRREGRGYRPPRVQLQEADPIATSGDPETYVLFKERLALFKERVPAGTAAPPVLPPSLGERRALEALAAGETPVETAARLGLSPETIKTQRKKLYAKLGARNGPHAVYLACQRGLLLE